MGTCCSKCDEMSSCDEDDKRRDKRRDENYKTMENVAELQTISDRLIKNSKYGIYERDFVVTESQLFNKSTPSSITYVNCKAECSQCKNEIARVKDVSKLIKFASDIDYDYELKNVNGYVFKAVCFKCAIEFEKHNKNF